MKKTFLLLLLAITCIACEGPTGPAGPMGPAGPQGEAGADGEGTNWYSTSFTIKKSDWSLAGQPGDLNSYFFADRDIPRLTEFIYKGRTVVCYIETAQGIKNGLPFVLHMGEESGGSEFLWTQTYDFDFTPGSMRFYVTYSDFNTQISPDTETFHVVLMW